MSILLRPDERTDGTYVKKPCTVCNIETAFACSDCAINSGGVNRIHVCMSAQCQKEHEDKYACTPI